MARASVTNVPIATSCCLLEVDARGATGVVLSLAILAPAESRDDLRIRVQACRDREAGNWFELMPARAVGELLGDVSQAPIEDWEWVRVLAVRGDGRRVPRVSGVLQTEP